MEERQQALVKKVRSITSLGLKEAKDFIEGAPVRLTDRLPNGDAEQLAESFRAVGATVTVESRRPVPTLAAVRG